MRWQEGQHEKEPGKNHEYFKAGNLVKELKWNLSLKFGDASLVVFILEIIYEELDVQRFDNQHNMNKKETIRNQKHVHFTAID